MAGARSAGMLFGLPTRPWTLIGRSRRTATPCEAEHDAGVRGNGRAAWRGRGRTPFGHNRIGARTRFAIATGAG